MGRHGRRSRPDPASAADCDPAPRLSALLEAVQRRRRAAVGLRWLLVGASGGSGLLAGLLLWHWAVPERAFLAPWSARGGLSMGALALALYSAVFLGALLRALTARAPRVWAARALDRSLDTGTLYVTAYECASGEERSLLGHLLVAQAERAAAAVEPARVVPLASLRALKAALGALVVGIALVIGWGLARPPWAGKPPEPGPARVADPKAPARRQVAEELRQLAASLRTAGMAPSAAAPPSGSAADPGGASGDDLWGGRLTTAGAGPRPDLWEALASLLARGSRTVMDAGAVAQALEELAGRLEQGELTLDEAMRAVEALTQAAGGSPAESAEGSTEMAGNPAGGGSRSSDSARRSDTSSEAGSSGLVPGAGEAAARAPDGSQAVPEPAGATPARWTGRTGTERDDSIVPGSGGSGGKRDDGLSGASDAGGAGAPAGSGSAGATGGASTSDRPGGDRSGQGTGAGTQPGSAGVGSASSLVPPLRSGALIDLRGGSWHRQGAVYVSDGGAATASGASGQGAGGADLPPTAGTPPAGFADGEVAVEREEIPEAYRQHVLDYFSRP